MKERTPDWTALLSQAQSFRRIYDVSMAIAESGVTSSEVRTAARQVVKSLGAVIDLPIADARILLKARKRFAKLCRLLSTKVATEGHAA